MNEPVDKELTSRIRQVFDHFEDPTADAGWQELRRNFPQRNRRPLILWLGSAAAIFLILTGIWIKNRPEQPVATLKSLTTVKKSAKLIEGPSGNPNEIITAAKPEDGGHPAPFLNEENAGLKTGINHRAAADISDTSRKNDHQGVQVTANVQPIRPVEFSDPKIKTEIGSANSLQVPQNVMPGNLGDKAGELKLPFLVLKTPEIQTLPSISSNEKTIYSIREQPESASSPKFPESRRIQKIAFSVVAGSYFNFSEGSENQLNFGAGLLSDIRLGKNLKLSTGLTLASNTLKYTEGNDVPETATSSFDSPKAISVAGSLKTITSMNASLLALDIPINLKYQLIPDSDQFYFTAGLSSGTYLNETYKYQYRHFNMATGTYTNQTRDQELKDQFNSFDLGRTLNLSLGLSSAFGKTQTLSIEPFLKYPLGGLGSENIRFGSTGINLKLHFKSLKK